MNTEIQQASQRTGVDWRNVGLYLGLTFALTWLLNLTLWRVGFGASIATTALLQLQMLLPAFAAISLSMFAFKESKIYYKNYHERPRWFFYFYLVFTLGFAGLAVLILALPAQAETISAVTGVFNILGLIILIAIRLLSPSGSFARGGISGGKPLQWLLWGLAFILFYTLQTVLNATFNLGQPSDPNTLLAGLSGGQSTGMSAMNLRILLFFQTVIIGPLLGLLMGFGEEYGWRGFLQSELFKLGKRRGVLLLGVIWGIWHYPVIWMGHNYPGQPLWGTLMMTGFTILLGFVLSHVMLKTGSIWLVSFLHALNNQVLAYFAISFYQVDNAVISFGIGIFGLLSMIPIVLLLLRDRVWREEVDKTAESIEPAPIS
jgi:membrane protease YdiL (CAAX protease family)